MQSIPVLAETWQHGRIIRWHFFDIAVWAKKKLDQYWSKSKISAYILYTVEFYFSSYLLLLLYFQLKGALGGVLHF